MQDGLTRSAKKTKAIFHQEKKKSKCTIHRKFYALTNSPYRDKSSHTAHQAAVFSASGRDGFHIVAPSAANRAMSHGDLPDSIEPFAGQYQQIVTIDPAVIIEVRVSGSPPPAQRESPGDI